jgi:hypothetical protein
MMLHQNPSRHVCQQKECGQAIRTTSIASTATKIIARENQATENQDRERKDQRTYVIFVLVVSVSGTIRTALVHGPTTSKFTTLPRYAAASNRTGILVEWGSDPSHAILESAK